MGSAGDLPNGWKRVRGYERHQDNQQPRIPSVMIQGCTGIKALLVLAPLSRQGDLAAQNCDEISPLELAELGFACLWRSIRASLRLTKGVRHAA